MSKNYKKNFKNAEQHKTVAVKTDVEVKKNGNGKKVFAKFVPYIVALAFAAFAYYILVALNSDYLFNVQERSMWVDDISFWHVIVVKAGGVMNWLGCYLTQYFYYPALGSSILIALWLVIYWLTMKAFDIPRRWCVVALIPVMGLLASVVDMGYWLYFLKMPGYWFTHTLSVLLCMAAIWTGNALRKKSIWASTAWIVVWTFIGYLLTGWWGMLATLCLAVKAIFSQGKLRWVEMAAGIVAIAVVPLICYPLFTQTKMMHIWGVGFPRFAISDYVSWVKSVPFFVIAASFIAFAFIYNKNKKVMPAWSVVTLSIVMLALMAWGVWTANFDDNNYHREMRVYRAANEGNWDEVLRETAENPDHPTREIILFKNLALIYKGTIGDNMFRYDNYSIQPYTDDSLVVHMVQTNAPLVYMLYARTNFATRWCMENSVEYGFHADDYKIMTRCALVAHEFDAARKYIDILKKTTFQKEWTKEYEPMLTDTTLIDKHPVLGVMREYYRHFRSVLDGDEGLVEMYLLNYFSQTQNKDSKQLQETTLVFALISKDIQKFWPKFFLYASMHKGEEMPIHYQEAAYLYGNLEHEVDISTMPFNPERIVNRYINFNQTSQSLLSKGYSTEQVGELMKANYGDTFWWFYFFCRDLTSY